MLVVEQALGQGAGQFGLADAGGPQEEEASDGALGILQTAAGTQDGVGNGVNRLVLAHNAFVQLIGEVDQLFDFTLHEF